MSESNEWRRDEFVNYFFKIFYAIIKLIQDDYFTTWAYTAVRMRELPQKNNEKANAVTELRIDMFKVLSYFSKDSTV